MLKISVSWQSLEAVELDGSEEDGVVEGGENRDIRREEQGCDRERFVWGWEDAE